MVHSARSSGKDHDFEMEDDLAAQDESPVPFDSLQPLAPLFSTGDHANRKDRKLAVPDLASASPRPDSQHQGMSSAELLASDAFAKYLEVKPAGPTAELDFAAPADMSQLALRAIFMT